MMTGSEWELLAYKYGQGLDHDQVLALRLYVLEHIPPGSFLKGVLSNDLKNTMMSAHSCLTLDYIKHLVWFIEMTLPSQCWGTEETYWGWLKEGALDD
jgi:hypothetical protein